MSVLQKLQNKQISNLRVFLGTNPPNYKEIVKQMDAAIQEQQK